MRKFFKKVGENFRNPLKQTGKPVIDRDSRFIGLKDYARMYIRAIDRYNDFDCGDPLNNDIKKLCGDDIKKIEKYHSDTNKSRHFSNSCLKDKNIPSSIATYSCISDMFEINESNKYQLITYKSKSKPKGEINQNIIDKMYDLYVTQYKYFTDSEWDNIIKKFKSINEKDKTRHTKRETSKNNFYSKLTPSAKQIFSETGENIDAHMSGPNSTTSHNSRTINHTPSGSNSRPPPSKTIKGGKKTKRRRKTNKKIRKTNKKR